MIFLSERFVCGASVVGPGHIVKGIPNQDSFLCVKTRKYSLFIVSDGMGSKPFSDVGSKMACFAVRKEVERFVKNKDKPLPITSLFENIVESWKNLLYPREAADCSATCLLVFATKRKILVARLGDGMVCLLGKDVLESVVLTDDKKDSFSNTTNSLSDLSAVREFKYGFYDRSHFKGIVLCTDGISADMEIDKELAFAEDVFCEVRKKFFWRRNSFIRNMMKKWPVPHHTDDKTIVIAGL
jgi:serine/threonine protein phosphatase PrpC